MRRRTRSALGGALTVALLFPFVPASADQEVQEKPEAPDEITPGMLADSVTRYSPVITAYDAEASVEELGEAESDEEDVIVLETDILFAAMESELPGSAGSAIAGLVADIPDGVAVDVHGHTDSNPVPEGYDFDNQDLSENRAEAVAEVLEEERPDLTLNVEGFGDSNPAVAEDPEDPGTYAANRRVEIRYGD